MFKKTKGSILAYSLLILAMMFAIIGSMSSIATLQKKSAGSSQASSQAFQVADNAVQIAVKKINAGLAGNNTIAQVFPISEFSCTDNPAGAIIKGNIESDNQKPFVITFADTDNKPITTCTTTVKNISNIKSVGSFQNTTRAVSVKVGNDDPCGGNTTVADTFGNTYPIKAYKSQCWMVKNLNSGSDSDVILNDAVSPSSNTKIEKRCPLNVLGNCVTHGALYDWSEALQLDQSCNSNDCTSQIQSNHQGVCPSGWHIPTEAEWNTFGDNIYNLYKYSCATVSSYNAKSLASTSEWKSSTAACATGNNQADNNASGFNVSPMLTIFAGSIGTYSYLWTTNKSSMAVTSARAKAIWNDRAELLSVDIIKKSPFYVRCIKN